MMVHQDVCVAPIHFELLLSLLPLLQARQATDRPTLLLLLLLELRACLR